jgi:hypothetical protein
VTADASFHQHTALLRRQAIYLLGFDTRASPSGWLRTEQRRALSDAGRTDHIRSWTAVRSSAAALACGGDRDPLRAVLRHALATDRLEQANLNYWAYWVGEIGDVQVDDGFMGRVDPRGWEAHCAKDWLEPARRLVHSVGQQVAVRSLGVIRFSRPNGS